MHRLALTIGDPTGIGPEITVKALQRLDELADTHLTVIGSIKALEDAAKLLGRPLPSGDRVSFHPIEDTAPGKVAYSSIETAVRIMADKKADVLVTGPISKRNLADAGFPFPGHTEILEKLAREIFNAPNSHAEMLFQHEKFRLLLLTRHIALKDVPAALAQSGAVARPLKTLISYLRNQQNISEPRIAILGINPHSGEVGGDEEKKYLLPVIHAVNGIGNTQLEGPFPADGFFRGFDPRNTPYDAVVAAYHDQGLIPFKIMAGYAAVNVTIGLPFLRTSVSHGTAEAIVGKGIANESSLMAAIKLAGNILPT
jgi:4-hydroxythreonine-4-phosphate dehydrogenase